MAEGATREAALHDGHLPMRALPPIAGSAASTGVDYR